MRRSSRAFTLLEVLVAIAISAAATAWILRRPAPPVVAASPVRFEIPPSATIAGSGSFALSPDGKRIVFIGTGADRRFRMWERSLESLEIKPISGTEGEVAANSTMFWSPDGQSIGFFQGGSTQNPLRAEFGNGKERERFY